MKVRRFFMIMMTVIMGSQVIVLAQEKNNQQRPQRMSKEEMQKAQLERTIKALELDNATAAKFTPIYQEYLNELSALQPEMPGRPEGPGPEGQNDKKDEVNKNVKKERPQMSDAQIDEMMSKRFDNAKKQAEVQEKYYKKFRTILPAQKASRALENMQHRGPQMGGGPGMGGHRPQGNDRSKKIR